MTAPRPLPASTLGSDDPYWTIKRRVIEETGHFYYADKDDALLDRLRRRLAVTRDPGLTAYLARLSDRLDGPAEWRALEAEISIGETFFFRYADQFEALRTTILPDLFERNVQTRQLRIWSAGCSTGAEAYSIAILLNEMLGDRLGDWRISILGTDLNTGVLKAARQAVYTRWALRSLSAEQKQAWFTEADGRWTLKTRYRGLVRFERGNLLDLLGPAPPLELFDYDLILCRNVLIYFHPDRVMAVARALVERLNPDGWLLVGHAEANPDFDQFAKAVRLKDGAAYRPLGAEALADAPSAPAWTPEPAPDPAAVEPPPAPRRPTPPPAPDPPPEPAASLEQIRGLADRGQLTAAAELCAQAIGQTPQDAGLHYFAGLIHRGLDQIGQAEDAFRRAVYLDGGFIMAHYQLGLARLDRNKTSSGRQSIRTAANLAGTESPDLELREGVGLTAGDLRDLARLHLETRGARGTT